jgi:sortase A
MHTVRRVIAGVGRAFISTGVLVLLFAVYELWGTGIAEANAQKGLKGELNRVIHHTVTKVGQTTGTSLPVPTTAYNPPPPPPAGTALAMLRIDKIGLTKAIVEGVGTEDLKKGPGHYTGTPMPGEAGNVAIAGHRTTYGAPFYHINELQPGDPIQLTTAQGTFTYLMTEQKVVGPNDNYVLDPTNDNRLTLTTCHPRFSAAQRLIVIAQLQGQPLGVRTQSAGGVALQGGDDEGSGSNSSSGAAPAASTGNGGNGGSTAGGGTAATGGQSSGAGSGAATGGGAGAAATGRQQPASARKGGVSGRQESRGPAIEWGVIAALVALGVWVLGKRWRKWPAYALGAPVFLLVLFVFFENFASLLPANV